MNNPLIHTFFVGRALAQVLRERLEESLTYAMGELGKFDAEQRERLRQFTQEVLERAAHEENSPIDRATASPIAAPKDLQAMIDELRSEIARLRSELQAYRNQVNK